jgi:antitoxin (DNA-binding transcriptional repressor) of toxin-antitoxin stability system
MRQKNAMIEDMATVRITDAELARDIHAVLAQVREGVEVIVEQDHRPVAVIKTPQGPGRKISECIALAKAYEEKLGYAPMPTSPRTCKRPSMPTASRLIRRHGIGPRLRGADRRRA